MLHFTAHRGLLVLTLFFPVDTDIVVGRLYLGRAAVDAVIDIGLFIVLPDCWPLGQSQIAGISIDDIIILTDELGGNIDIMDIG